MRVDGAVDKFVGTCCLVENMSVSEVVMKGFVGVVKYWLSQNATAVELRNPCLARNSRTRKRVRLMRRLGWGHLIVGLSVIGHLTVATRIISARRNAILKRRNRLIARSRRMWSPIALAGRLLSKFCSRSLDSIARYRYLTARRNVKSCFHVDISASRYATMEIADHVWRWHKSRVVVAEPHRTVYVIKALKNHHPAPESAARLWIAVDTNAESAAVLEKRKPANGKSQNARIAVWQQKRMSSPSTSASEFVAVHWNAETTPVHLSATKGHVLAVSKQYLKKSLVPVDEQSCILLNPVALALHHATTNAPAAQPAATKRLSTNATKTPSPVLLALTLWRNHVHAARKRSRINPAGLPQSLADCLAARS
jgi:hypothetical protein